MSSSSLPVEFEKRLFQLQGTLFSFMQLEAESLIPNPNYTDEHELSVLSRQVIKNERLTLTHDIRDIGSKYINGQTPQQLSEQNLNIAGVYPFGQNLVFINVETNLCIPNTYVHELAHHFDFKDAPMARFELIINSMLGKMSREEVNRTTNEDELVAQSVAHIICEEYGVDANVITAMSNLILFQRDVAAAVDFVGGKLNQRIFRVYTSLTDALRGASLAGMLHEESLV